MDGIGSNPTADSGPVAQHPRKIDFDHWKPHLLQIASASSQFSDRPRNSGPPQNSFHHLDIAEAVLDAVLWLFSVEDSSGDRL